MTVKGSVLLVTEQIDVGGKRSHVESLRAGLDAIGWRADLLDWSSLSRLERAAAAGPYRLLDHASPALGERWRIPIAARIFANHIRRSLATSSGPRVVHVQEVSTYKAARAAAGANPIVLTVHGPFSGEVASARGLGLDHPTVQYLREVERHAYLGADGVVSVDRPHAEYVRGFGRDDGTWVIPNFVDTRRFHPDVPVRPFREAMEVWIAGRPVVLSPRRLVPKNGVDVAIRAAGALARQGASFALVIVGEGPQRTVLERLIRREGLEEVVGLAGEAPADQIPGFCRRARAVVVSSVPSQGVEEATSIAVLEAQACGRPVVASSIGGLIEIVRDGEDGILVPPGDPARLADAIAGVLRDPVFADRMGSAGARRVAAEHSHVVGARKYAEVYAAVRKTPGQETKR